MKLPASRSLLHGHRRAGGDGERPAYALPGGGVRRRSPPGSGKPCSRTVARYAGLPGEHVEVAGEPRPGVQPAAGVGRPGHHARIGEVVVDQRLPGRKPMTSIPRSGRYSTTGAPTPASAAAGCWRAPPSRSMPSRPASLVSSAPRRPVRSRRRRRSPGGCGWSARRAGPRRDQDRPARTGEAVQVGIDLDVSPRTPRRPPRRWCASGPVNQFFADTCHQIARSEERADVTIGE